MRLKAQTATLQKFLPVYTVAGFHLLLAGFLLTIAPGCETGGDPAQTADSSEVGPPQPLEQEPPRQRYTPTRPTEFNYNGGTSVSNRPATSGNRSTYTPPPTTSGTPADTTGGGTTTSGGSFVRGAGNPALNDEPATLTFDSGTADEPSGSTGSNQLNPDLGNVRSEGYAGAPDLGPPDGFATGGSETYVVKSGDNLTKIARRFDTTVDAIKSANGLSSDLIRVGQELTIPAGTAAAAEPAGESAPPLPPNIEGQPYIVARGDTLSGIASRFGTTVDAIKAANGLQSDLIRVGQELVIPKGRSSSGSAPQSNNRGTAAGPPEGEETTAADGTIRYTLAQNDTLGEIAQRYGVTVVSIMRANDIQNPRRVRAGQTIVIPGASAAGGTGSTAATGSSSASGSTDKVPSSAPATSIDAPVRLTPVEDTDDDLENAPALRPQ